MIIFMMEVDRIIQRSINSIQYSNILYTSAEIKYEIESGLDPIALTLF
jgi:hypothetical protein